MKNIKSLEKKVEELRRWLERAKVLKVVFMAIIGLRLLPIVAGDSPTLLTVMPVFFYFAIEEIRILLDSKVRILDKKIQALEKEIIKSATEAKIRQNRTLKFRRKNHSEIDH